MFGWDIEGLEKLPEDNTMPAALYSTDMYSDRDRVGGFEKLRTGHYNIKTNGNAKEQ